MGKRRWTKEKLDELYAQTKYKSGAQLSREMGYISRNAVNVILYRYKYPRFVKNGRRTTRVDFSYLTPLETGYIAGILDGEGHILKKTEIIRVTNTNKPLLLWLKQKLGGSVMQQTVMNPDYKKSWYWNLSCVPSRSLLRLLAPHLIVKREQAQQILDEIDEK